MSLFKPLMRTPNRWSHVRSLASIASTRPPRDFSRITPPYQKLESNLQKVKRVLDNRPMTLSEKILYSHLTEPEEAKPIRGQTYLKLSPGN
ncbi:aconitate hydratase [Entomortierella lignicola]|nr:aconitate hydratase [Entomortierella lignicola]